MADQKEQASSNLAPTMWHGMTARQWFTLLARHGFDVSGRRIPRAVLVSAISTLNSVLSLVCRYRYGGAVASTQIVDPPVFVVGHWRTGTTAMHELLTADDAHIAPNGYQVMVPEHFLLTEKLFPPLLAKLMPSDRGFDAMRLDLIGPQEDEFAITALGLGSPFELVGFPRSSYAERWLPDALDPLGLDADRFELLWLNFLKAVQHSAPGKRLILKSPVHTMRIATILKLFPDARFVHVVRDPAEVLTSTRRMFQHMIDVQGLQSARTDDDLILGTFAAMYRSFWQDETLIPQGRLALVHNETLRQAPETVLSEVYASIGLPAPDPSSHSIKSAIGYLKRVGSNASQPSDEDRAKARQACGEYAKRYGYLS